MWISALVPVIRMLNERARMALSFDAWGSFWGWGM